MKEHANILKVTPFREADAIITFLGAETGLFKGVLKGARSAKRGYVSFLNAPSLVEVVYKPSDRELKTLQELSLIEGFLGLRKALPRIEAACHIAKTALDLLSLEKPVPALFLLFNSFLEKIQRADTPERYPYAFILKTLRHEGVLEEEKLTPCERELLECRKSVEIENKHLSTEVKEKIAALLLSQMQQ